MPDLQRQFRELKRRRVFRTLAAYLVFAWLALQVADATFEPLGLPAWSQRALIIAVIAGIVPVAMLAWVFDLTRRGLVRTARVESPANARGLARSGATSGSASGSGSGAASGIGIGAGSGATRGGIDGLPAAVVAGPMSAIASIAVLPFTDLSQARDQDWFCDGLAEEIIDSLCCVRGLRVASRTASFRFRDGTVDPREIGRLLNVDAILEGSVRQAGDRLRVTAQLVDAGNGYHQWSETYERQAEDVFAIQADIARHVAEQLKLSLAGPELGRSLRYAPRNLQAYEFYLRGRQLAGQTGETAWAQAPTMFRRAIELEPDYAQAQAGLADSLAQLILWRFAPADALLPEAAAAAAKALDLAPDLAEAHVAQGHVRSLSGDDEGAVRSFERAIALNPGLHEAYYYYARHCYARGEWTRAADLFQQAFRTRTDDYSVLALAVNALEAGGDAAGAEVLAKRALEGMLHQCALQPDDPRVHYMAGGLMLHLGQRESGVEYAEKALALRPDDFGTIYNVACAHSLAGHHERALDLLVRALAKGRGYYHWIVKDSDLAPLRELPRFQQLLATIRGRG
jgi:TolB-like protein/thioredoxin-like negative regulator of GroEL